LPADFWILRDTINANDERIYFMGYDYSADMPVDVSPEPKLYFIELQKIKTAQVARENLPFGGEDYLSLKSVVHENGIFTFGFKNLTRGEGLPEAADEATAFMGILNKSGQVQNWQQLSIGLPPNIPHDNGGFFLKASGGRVYAVIYEDAPTMRVYELAMTNGQPELWQPVGELPSLVLGSAQGLSSSVLFLDDAVISFGNEGYNRYQLADGKIGRLLQSGSIAVVDDSGNNKSLEEVTANRYEPYFVSMGSKLLMVIPETSPNDKVSIGLY
jgi:hypothetical protein